MWEGGYETLAGQTWLRIMSKACCGLAVLKFDFSSHIVYVCWQYVLNM
jgi:hypothetical protein